jgi:hypothetical protein
MTALPSIVSPEDFEAARLALLEEEKALTRQLDALAARRRRLPMTPVRKDYVLQGEDGDVALLELFGGRRQLAIYHFMFPAGQQTPCVGCSTFTDNIPPDALTHLAQRDTAFTLMSPAPIGELFAYRERMGWNVPWHSMAGTTLTDDLGAGGGFRLMVLLRDDEDVYLTYSTTSRGLGTRRPACVIAPERGVPPSFSASRRSRRSSPRAPAAGRPCGSGRSPRPPRAAS